MYHIRKSKTEPPHITCRGSDSVGYIISAFLSVDLAYTTPEQLSCYDSQVALIVVGLDVLSLISADFYVAMSVHGSKFLIEE